MKTASSLLKFGGSLKLCQIPLRLADVICSMRSHGIEPKVMQNVVNRTGGKPWLVLISGKRAENPEWSFSQILRFTVTTATAMK